MTMTSNPISISTAALPGPETEGASVTAVHAAFAVAAEAVQQQQDEGDDAPHSELAAAAAAAGTCHAERHYLMANQSLPILVALCRGVTDHQGNKILDIDAEPWCSVRLPARSIKPKAKDYINEIERRWNTFLRPLQCSKVGPRPAAWTHAQLVDWLDKHPIVDEVEVAYLTSKVQEARAAVIEANQLPAGNTSSSNGDDGEVVPVIEIIDMDANNDDGRTAQETSPSTARGINDGGGNASTVQASQATTNNNIVTRTDDTFASLSESIKWLGTSVLASAKLYATQKEKDREMTIAENEKDRKAQLEMAKLDAERREKEIANERAKQRIDALRLQIDTLRKEKRQLTVELLSDSSKRSKTIQDFLTGEIEQMAKDTQVKEKELNNLIHGE